MSNRIVLFVFALCFGAAALTAQMRELGHWHGGRYYGPRSDWQSEQRQYWQERRQELLERRGELRQRLQERLEDRQRMRGEFRRSLRDLPRHRHSRTWRWN